MTGHFGHRWGAEHILAGSGRVHYCVPEDVFIVHDASGVSVAEFDGDDADVVARGLVAAKALREQHREPDP